MKNLMLISISLVIIILTGCDNINTILLKSQKTFTSKQEKTTQTEPKQEENIINYCDILYSNDNEKTRIGIYARNIYVILINSHNELLVEGELVEISQLKEGIKSFINNYGQNAVLSDSPEQAVFLIQSEGISSQDEKIIELIHSEYHNLNIPLNKRKICHMTGNILEEWRSLRPPLPPPPPPKIIEIVEDEVEIENELEIEDTASDEDEIIEIEGESDDEFFMVVENMPEFPGGDIGLMKYIQKNVKYPPIAKEYNITGKVYVSFIVDKSGSVTNVKIVRGVDQNLDAEAMRVVKSLPKYKPGKQRGKAVRVMFTIPINFTLN